MLGDRSSSSREVLKGTRTEGHLGSSEFHLAGSRAESVADDEREDIGVDPGAGAVLASLRELADAAGQPAGLTAVIAAFVLLDPAATHRDLAHAQPAVHDMALDGLA